jgi:hypothetical protein
MFYFELRLFRKVGNFKHSARHPQFQAFRLTSQFQAFRLTSQFQAFRSTSQSQNDLDSKSCLADTTSATSSRSTRLASSASTKKQKQETMLQSITHLRMKYHSCARTVSRWRIVDPSIHQAWAAVLSDSLQNNKVYQAQMARYYSCTTML